MPRLDAACAQYVVRGDYLQIIQDGDILLAAYSHGNKLDGKIVLNDHHSLPSTGNVSGEIKGRSIDFTATWDDGPAAGSWGKYKGTVADDGTVRGTGRNSRGVQYHWFTHESLACARPPVVPAPGRPVGPTATVTSDVDRYDVPGGTKIGVLRKGQVVSVVKACTPNDWCQLATHILHGWAWGKFLKNN
jgi:hypothetical protein